MPKKKTMKERLFNRFIKNATQFSFLFLGMSFVLTSVILHEPANSFFGHFIWVPVNVSLFALTAFPVTTRGMESTFPTPSDSIAAIWKFPMSVPAEVKNDKASVPQVVLQLGKVTPNAYVVISVPGLNDCDAVPLLVGAP